MKKTLIVLCCAIILLQACGNQPTKNVEEDEMVSEAEIKALPLVDTTAPYRTYDKSGKIIFSRVVSLDTAATAIDAYRRKGALFNMVFRDKKFGIAHDDALTDYINNQLPAFIATRKGADAQGYQWQAGFVFGVGQLNKKPVLNIYIMPVLVPKTKGTGVVALDYFQLKKAGDPKVELYWPDDVNSRTRAPGKPDSSFVFDEGALWP